MKKVGTKLDLSTLDNLPRELTSVIRNIVDTLNENYGSWRDVDTDMGGYLIIIEKNDDFKMLNKELCINLEYDSIPEYVDLIMCENGKVFTNSLILCNNDFGITFIIPIELTPENLKNYMLD